MSCQAVLKARLDKRRQEEASHMATRPIHEVRRGLIKVSIWRKRSRSGHRYSVTVVRLFRNGHVWKQSTRFSREDIPLIRLALEVAHGWLYEQTGEELS